MDNIKVTVEEPSSVKRKITVELPAEEVDRYFKETFGEYRRSANLPGFRRGKVPMNIIESRFGEDVKQDVTRRILPDSYEKALNQEGLKPVSEPDVGDLTLERGQALSYTAEFEVLAAFDLDNYLGIELENQELEVKEEEVDAILEDMRSGQATVVKCEENRGLRGGDVAMIDFEGMAEGQPIPGGSSKDFPLTVGSDTFLPGFEDSLIGAVVDEEREFFLKLPEDFQEGELAGKEAKFKVRLKEIRERTLPALDDDFAKDVGDFENLEALRTRLRTNLMASKEATSRDTMKEQLIDTLVAANPIEVPPTMVSQRRDMMMANVERNLLMRGISKEEIDKSRDKMHADAAEPAEKKVRATLLLERVAEKEKIEVSEEELNAEIARIAAQNKMDPGQARRRMVENGSLDNLREMLREEKAVDFLLEKAKVTVSGASAPAPEKGKEKS